MSGAGLRGFVAELKRRKVFRVAVVYGGVGFVVAQAADIAFPALQLPAWTVTLVVVLVLLGFPVALVLAWAFELTPDGIVRTEGAGEPGTSPEPGAHGPSLGAGSASTERSDRSSVPSRSVGPLGPARTRLLVAGTLLALTASAVLVLRASPEEGTIPGSLAHSLVRSVAVLPFTDLSPQGDHQWFSDGLTEDIQIHLAHIRDVKVIGHTSVMRYRDRDVGARQIGAELDVAHILRGSVRRDGDRVRVSVQFISTATDEQLWGDSYDRELTAADIFELQTEIARQIAQTLRARLSPEDRQRMAQAPTEDLQAYELYWRGRELAQRLTRADLEEARVLFHHAAELDPEFALAQVGLAYSASAMDGYHHLGAHWRDSARVAASRAVELDPGSADSYVVLALSQWNDGHLQEAVATYRRALSIRPGDAEAYWGLAFVYWALGDPVTSIQMSLRAVEFDPGHPGHLTLLGRGYASVGAVERGIEWLRRALALQADFPWAHQDLLWILIGNGRLDEAERHLRTMADTPTLAREYAQNAFLLALARGDLEEALARYRAAPDDVVRGVVMRADAAHVLRGTGNENGALELRDQAEEAFRAAAETGTHGAWPSVELARAAAAAGDHDTALEWLERATEQGWLAFPALDLARDPVLAGLHGSPRFQQVRTRILDRTARLRAEVERDERVQPLAP